MIYGVLGQLPYYLVLLIKCWLCFIIQIDAAYARGKGSEVDQLEKLLIPMLRNAF